MTEYTDPDLEERFHRLRRAEAAAAPAFRAMVSAARGAGRSRDRPLENAHRLPARTPERGAAAHRAGARSRDHHPGPEDSVKPLRLSLCAALGVFAITAAAQQPTAPQPQPDDRSRACCSPRSW